MREDVLKDFSQCIIFNVVAEIEAEHIKNMQGEWNNYFRKKRTQLKIIKMRLFGAKG